MMMECIARGGVEVVRSDPRDAWARTFDGAGYQGNANGLYEVEMAEMRRPGFPRWHDGKAIKLVLPFLSYLAVHAYRIVLMTRDPEEIRQSYQAAFRVNLGSGFVERYPELVEEACQSLSNRHDVWSVRVVAAQDVWGHPTAIFRQLVKDGWPLDPVQAASAVVPSRVRFRREHLVVGL